MEKAAVGDIPLWGRTVPLSSGPMSRPYDPLAVFLVRHDNLKAAGLRAWLDDPDVNEVYAALARH